MYNTLKRVESLKPLKACLQQQQQRMDIEFTTILILGWVDILKGIGEGVQSYQLILLILNRSGLKYS